jgi:hypothetical protein
MKFNPPFSSMQFAVIIDDIDSDDLDVTYHESEEAALAYVRSEYGDMPSPGEPDGQSYEPNERPNATIVIFKVVSFAVI